MSTAKLYPISDTQMGIYIETLVTPDKTIYNCPFLFSLPKSVDLSKLKYAVKTVFKAHPALNIRLTKHNNAIMQYEAKDENIDIKHISILNNELDKFKDEFVKPFDLIDSPLYHLCIVETETDCYFASDFYHIIYDGASLVLFFNELNKAYKGESCVIESTGYLEYAEAQINAKNSVKYLQDQEYFNNMLKGVEATTLPGDNPTNKDTHSLDLFIDKDAIGDVRSLGFSPNNVFQAATAIVLSRICRTNKVSNLTIHHGRTSKEMMNVTGFFVKTLPICFDVNPKLDVNAFIEYVRSTQQELYKHLDCAYATVSQDNGFSSDIYFSYQGILKEQYELNGELMNLEALDFDQNGMSILVIDKDDKYNLRVEFDAEEYSLGYATAIANAIKVVVTTMMQNRKQLISQLSLVDNDTELTTLAQGEVVDYDKELTYVDMILHQATINGNNRAVVDENGAYTFTELDNLSNILAHKLREQGIKENMFVGIMTPRIKEFIVAVLAVWKAGGAYLPLDSEYPIDRLQYMMEDSKSHTIITTEEMFASKSDDNGSFNVDNIIYIDKIFTQTPNNAEPINYCNKDNLAYMIYTSGSTGKPKGVMIKHSSLSLFVINMSYIYTLTSKDKICCHSSFSFDASIEDLYPIMSVGGELHILSQELRFDMRSLCEYINANGITGGGYTTQFGLEFLSQFSPNVRYLTVGGEKMDYAPKCDCDLYNTYGPTEFTVNSSYLKIDKSRQYKNIPIGRPMPNSKGFIMDMFGHLLPYGFAGELCMQGEQIAAGYWGREELTKERFVDTAYGKVYRTGDLAKYNSESQLEYLGRIDNQIKLRGFRIELGEIESALANYEGILSSCVIVCKISGVEHLCAYYNANAPIDKDKLKEHLAKSLTEYMVPTVYMQLDIMPLTPNGKINRKSLPAPILERTTELVAPTNKVEEDICNVFKKILKITEVSIDDDFFAIGGSSLIALTALISIENCGYTLTYGDMFKYKTPRKIAAFLSKGGKENSEIEDFPIDDYDYTNVNRVLNNQRKDFWTDFKLRTLESIVLTGATGYLGAHVLHHLLLNSKAKIYCLLRSKKDISAQKRLKTILMYYFDDTFDDYFNDRITIIEGDITDKTLADKFKFDYDTIINCAALVKHYEAGNDMNRINYEAVINLANCALAKNACIVHISTYSTAGVSVNDSVDAHKLYCENDLYIGQSHTIKYTWTKFLAERALLEMVATKGLRAKIMRVGNLMGRDSDGEFQINFRSNAFINSLRSYKALKAFPLSMVTDKTEESPIDLVAQSIVLLSTTPDDIVVLHPYNCYEHNMGAIILAMKDYGFDIDVVSDAEFQKRVNAMMNDSQNSHYLSGILHIAASETVRYIDADNKYTTTLLYHLGFHWKQSSVEYVSSLIKMLDTMGFFNV